jgi:16S rRNA (guanine966-N2)-methyltransferase
MRIVGGTLRGRSLTAPKSLAIRPTTDRVREALFNVIVHLNDFSIENARVLDLFAGTGALGIEALSRGAGFCLFVDTGVEARGLLRETIDTLGLLGTTKVFRRDATDLGPAVPQKPFDLVFADPPYGKGLAEKALTNAAQNAWIAHNALIIVEESADASLTLDPAFSLFDTRHYGDTIIRFYRWRENYGE